MLVIKKVSKEDPSTAFSAGFATAGALPTNGNKAPIAGSSVYKNLVPKPAVAPTKVGFPALCCTVMNLQDNHEYAAHVKHFLFSLPEHPVETRW